MIKKPEKHILKPKKIADDFTNKPVNTRNTTAQVRGVSRCAKNQHRTHTCDTRFGSTAGKPVPVRYPTYGWLKGASVTMEYGKNYEGYWTGELFVKQVSELILQTYYHPQSSCSFARRSFLNLKDCMAPSIRH
jgi:hypothetical protein